MPKKIYKYPHPTIPGKMVSRQRICQIKKQLKGKCMFCSAPAINKALCQKHQNLRNERSLKYYFGPTANFMPTKKRTKK